MVKKQSKTKKLTLSVKEEIRNKFVQGIEDTRGGRKLYTLDELAVDHNIAKPTLYKHAQKEEWQMQQKRFQDKYLEELDQKRRKELVQEAVNFDRTSLQLAKGLMGQIAQQLRARTEDEDGIKSSHLQQLSSALVQAQRVGKLSLGQPTENMNVNASTQETEAFREALGLLDEFAESRRKGNSKAIH